MDPEDVLAAKLDLEEAMREAGETWGWDEAAAAFVSIIGEMQEDGTLQFEDEH